MTKVETYQLVHYGSGSKAVQNRINLLDSYKKVVAVLVFYKEKYYQQTADTIISGAIRIYFPQSQFDRTLDILRNETPIYVHYSGKTGYIQTENEPIGEEES